MAVEPLHVGQFFETMEEVDAYVNQLREVLFYPLVVEKCSVESHNKKSGSQKIDGELWKYQSAKILCSHHGVHRNRSKGLRPNQKVYACKCPYTWYVTLNVRQKKYEVLTCNLEHANHPVSEELIPTYWEKKNLDPSALQYITDATRDGAIPLKGRKCVYDEYNVVLKPKTVQNIKQKVIGLPRDEWKNTVDLLNVVRDTPGSVVKVVHDENNEVAQILIQTKEQREFQEIRRFGRDRWDLQGDQNRHA